MTQAGLSWFGIVRLGLVQTALGAIVVLTTSTLNRVMVVELSLPAMLPGFLVALHYTLQMLRPRMGYGSDVGGRLTPWIIGGMAVLGIGGMLAAMATAIMSSYLAAGIALSVLGFSLIGAGVSAAGTSLLVLLAKHSLPARRPAAATIVWLMMIAGFAVTATVAGHFLDPYSPERLVAIAACVSVAAFLLTLAAIWGVEGGAGQGTPRQTETSTGKPPFREALMSVWGETQARRFTIFVFVSMLAYSAQDLILEPFAGAVFAFTPGESTKLGGLQHAGVFVGMVAVAVLSSVSRRWFGSLRSWTIGGCLCSAVALIALALAGFAGLGPMLRAIVFCLGVSNGAFAIAAIASMMMMASAGHAKREGVRMGLWGAAQAIAFGIGGLAGTIASDVARFLIGAAQPAYSLVFILEAGLFVVSAALAVRIGSGEQTQIGDERSAWNMSGKGMLAVSAEG